MVYIRLLKGCIMQTLTDKQIEVLQLIHDFSEAHSYPPTIQELAEKLGVKSKNAVVKHIEALRKKGHIVKDSSTARGIRIINNYYLRPDETVRESNEIPLVGQVAAGLPILAVENIDKHITIPSHMIKRNSVYYALRVRGESMIEAGINNQDVVVVEKTNQARHNEIVVALIEDEATVKRFKEEKGQVYLKAENESYPDIYPTSNWSVQGKVVGLIRDVM